MSASGGRGRTLSSNQEAAENSELPDGHHQDHSNLQIVPKPESSRPCTPPVNQQVLPPENENEPGPSSATVVVPMRASTRAKRDTQANSYGSNGGAIVIPVGKESSRKSKEKATLKERNASMLFNELMADVYFVVGAPGSNQQQRIPAHSYVMATASSVFYAMFYGGFPKSGDIIIPDVEPTAFRILLRYLYTDEIQLDADNVLSTLYVSKKYLVSHLTRACINYLETSLTASNVCLLLAQSRLFEEEELMQRCWELIDAQAEMALKSDGFLDVDFDTLVAILGRETLNVKETMVFDNCIRWAEAECKRRQIEITPSNLRLVLDSAFYLIRIPAMKIEEFANGMAQSGLLGYQETTDIFLWFTAVEKPQVAFVSKPRSGLTLHRCHRFQSSAYRSNQWRYRGRCDSIQFCTDRRIFVAGFGLYGSSNGAAEYKVQIELKRNGHTLACVHSKFFCDGSSNVFPVYFDHPVQVEPEVYYTASAILDGSELSYFGQEGMPEAQSGRITFQFQCSTESTNGTGVQGGQIPEILFYG